MGTWIETSLIVPSSSVCLVVPLVGTWIETALINVHAGSLVVVPLVGTWIETSHPNADRKNVLSFPSWERGLKHL